MKRTVAAPSQGETELYDVLEAKVIADMSPWCRMYDIGFQEVMDIDAEVTGDALDGTVAAVIMDHPYNTRSARNSPNSDHDKLSLDDMRNVVEMCDRLLKPGRGGTESSSLPCSSSATGTSTWQSSWSMSRKERNRSPWRSRCPLCLMWRRCLWFASERPGTTLRCLLYTSPSPRDS